MRAMPLMDKAIGALPGRNAIRVRIRAASVVAALVAAACAVPEEEPPARTDHSLEVTASAYNSTRAQTNDDPTLTAWGDTLEPGIRAIAVSRDLIPLGLEHGVTVRIDGLDGEYVVRDKMAARWDKKIDIYMGTDVAAAREWGKRDVTIYWMAD